MRENHPLVEIFKQKGRLDRTDIEAWQVISIATPFSRLVPRSVLPWFDDAEQPHGITIPYHAAAIFELFETDLIGEFAEPYARKILSLVPGLALLPFEGFTTYPWAPTLFWHPKTQLRVRRVSRSARSSLSISLDRKEPHGERFP